MKFAAVTTLTLVLLTGITSAAVFDNNEACRQIYAEMFQLRFGSTNTLIQTEKINNPSNLYVYSLEGYASFLHTLLAEEDKQFQKYKTDTEYRLSQIKTGQQNSPYFLLIQAELILQRALIRARFKEYFSAAIDIRKSYKLIEENRKKFPQFKPNLKILGLMHSVIGSVPQNYQWVVSLIGMQGTIKQGVSELKDLLHATQTDQNLAYLKNEVLLYLIFVESHLSKNKESSLALLNEFEKSNTSQLITFSVVNTYYTFDKNEQVIAILSKQKTDQLAYKMHYLDYLYALAKLNRLDGDADTYFRKYTQEFRGKNFIKSAYQKLAWHALGIKRDTALYHNYMSNCLKAGDDFSDEDKQALKEAEQNLLPNYYLLRARLLFDGGYYQKALNEIASKQKENFPNVKDKLELIYRLARIYDKMEQFDKAIDMYNKTIAYGEKLEYYYAANSSLNLGIIYENKGDRKNAEFYFRKCLSMRKHEYQNSIDQKAKAGLDRLGKK